MIAARGLQQCYPGLADRGGWRHRPQQHQSISPPTLVRTRALLEDVTSIYNSYRSQGSAPTYEPCEACGQTAADPNSDSSHTRTYYTLADWRKHRSHRRYIRHIGTIFESRVVRGLLRPVLAIVGIAVAVGLYNSSHRLGYLLSWPALPSIPMEPFQLTSIALSLLLVFRTNSSYARWDEGRRRFGAITTGCKDLMRQVLAYFRRDDAVRKAAAARWMIALCWSSSANLRDGESLRRKLDTILLPHEIQYVLASRHPPHYCLQVLSHLVAGSGAPRQALNRMEFGLSNMVVAVADCERIVNTPIPLSYTRHTTRFLVLWLALLPFALWPPCGWTTVPIVFIVAFTMLGIEDIGVQIEEPFGFLSLEGLCQKAENLINLKALEHAGVAVLMQDMLSQEGQQQAAAAGGLNSVLLGQVAASPAAAAVVPPRGAEQGQGPTQWVGPGAASSVVPAPFGMPDSLTGQRWADGPAAQPAPA